MHNIVLSRYEALDSDEEDSGNEVEVSCLNRKNLHSWYVSTRYSIQ